jgi:quercetin dioxygenase-like cupin family protein
LPDNSAYLNRMFARLYHPIKRTDKGGQTCQVIQSFSSQETQMEIVRKSSITTLSNSGVQSEQLLFPENSSSRRVTITRVAVEPGAVNPPHRHPASEQIWVALEGNGILLLDHERTEPFSAGDVVRFADGDLHGFRNASDVPFVYLSVTAPPVNFREAYSKDWSKSDRRSY